MSAPTMPPQRPGGLTVTLADEFWAPRQALLRATTLPTMLERLEEQGSIDNFRRCAGPFDGPFQAMHFADSDVYKWTEAALLAGRTDLAEPIVELIVAAQQPDGYLHTHYGVDGRARYADLEFGHEHYCFGHLLEAAVAHREVTGSETLIHVARRLADHLLATFGPGRDERTDVHPEVELALCRLATVTSEARYVDQAAWIIEQQLAAAGTSVDELRLGGHAVRALYLASGIAEVALATGDDRWRTAAHRLFTSMVRQHTYPTGAVGGRWLGEAVGKPYEQPDAMAYAESCAAVAAAQFSWRVWKLTADTAALDQLELLLFNAVPCGVGADGASWFYSQPHAVAEVAAEVNPWRYGFDYGELMLAEWFPARRHRWFDVACCPTNLGRMFATVDRHVAEVDANGDLLVHLPVAARVVGHGWDVEVGGRYPADGEVTVRVHAAPEAKAVRVRRPGWAGGSGHEAVPHDGHVALPVAWTWWTTSARVEGGRGSVHLRRGPVVHCVEGIDHPELDLRDLVVQPRHGPADAFSVLVAQDPDALHHPVAEEEHAAPVAVTTRPYADWANHGTGTMRLRFPT